MGLTADEISDILIDLKQPAYKGKQIAKWIYQKGVNNFEEMSDLVKPLREQLTGQFQINSLKPLITQDSDQCGTQKFLFETYDKLKIEAVLIPEEGRTTVCISCQVGCPLACDFCATGKMGFTRNLTAGEIIEQVWHLRKISEKKITNIVFMGMGEPFLNYDNVIKAAQILNDPNAFAIQKKKITLSTAGIVAKIRQYADEQHPFSLAISLHAPEQQLRHSIMPLAKKYPIDELMKSIKYYYKKTKKRVTYEYVLLAGINDSINIAKKLKKLVSAVPCKLNIIPYNDVGADYEKPSEEIMDQFIRILLDSPAAVTLRKSRGDDIGATCGQLAQKNK